MMKKKTTQTWGMMPIRKLEDDEEENYADVGNDADEERGGLQLPGTTSAAKEEETVF